MIAEIIAIGSEIVSGAKLDTNSQWLSTQLGLLGIEVGFHTSLADNLEANVHALNIAAGRADVIIVSGGLGPTLDDLTRQAIAYSSGVPLYLDEVSLRQIEEMFRRRGRVMPDRNRIQAEFPMGSIPLPNAIGTAPGIWMERPGTSGPPLRIAALPGVPSELKRMFLEQVVPRLPGSGHVIRYARIHCFGCGESQADELLGDLTARGRDPEIGITAHDATITLRIQAIGAVEQECFLKIEEASLAIRDRLGRFVFGIEDEELEHVVLRTLQQREETLSVIDTGSRGWLPSVLAAAAGPSSPFLGALLCNGMPQATAAIGPLEGSNDTASLAAACARRFQSTYALAIGEIPDLTIDALAASDQRTTVSLVGPGLQKTVKVTIGGNPAILAPRLGKEALNLLRLALIEQADSTGLA